MITASFGIVVTTQRKKEVLETLRSIIGPTRAKPGCIGCRIYQDMENRRAIVYEETWKTRLYLDRHIHSKLFRSLLALIDMSCEPPDIKISTVVQIEGIEALESLNDELTEKG